MILPSPQKSFLPFMVFMLILWQKLHMLHLATLNFCEGGNIFKRLKFSIVSLIYLTEKLIVP